MSREDCPLGADSCGRILEALDVLKEQHSQILERVAEIRAKLEHAAGKADTVHHVVLGNGEPDRGLASRLARLEDAEGRRKWVIVTAAGAAIAVLVKAVSDLIHLGSR